MTFPEIESVTASIAAIMPVAEGHGCLCGALCVSNDYSFDRWLQELVPGEALPVAEDARQPLQLLYAATLRDLRGDEMEFEPFLPDDEVTLGQRTAALSQWCQGFLFGFGITRALDSADLPENVNEILRDLTDLSHAAAEADEAGNVAFRAEDGNEAEESAYAEVVEYLRVGVQLIHDELAPIRDLSQVESRQAGAD